jgi:pimeloyl-ACP methyl ester carboxylesterase
MDLLVSPGSASHLDLAWTDPDLTRFLRRLATFARVILYDKPGTGLSDPITRGALGPLESASEAFQRLGAAPALERVRELLDSDAAGPAAARGRVQTASADH